MWEQKLVKVQVLTGRGKHSDTWKALWTNRDVSWSLGLKRSLFQFSLSLRCPEMGILERVIHGVTMNLNSVIICSLTNARFICLDLPLDIECCRETLWCLKSQHSCPDTFPRKHFFCSLSCNIFPREACKTRMTGYGTSMSMDNWTQFKGKLSFPVMA